MSEQQAVTIKRDFRWWWRKQTNRLREWMLEDQAAQGLGGPPNNWRSISVTDKQDRTLTRYAHFGNDAHEVMLGHAWSEGGHISEKWDVFIRAEAFRKIALWYLWRWAWGEWFGLRRWLYYKWLAWYVSEFTNRVVR